MGYRVRRDAEWKQQVKIAKQEIRHWNQQIVAADIRLQMANKELENLQEQIEQKEAVEQLLSSKFTNKQLYNWMASQFSMLYFQAYQLAHDLAMKAQAAYQYELGVDDVFVTFDHWDSLKKGLLVGDNLHQQLRNMESAYLETNQRDMEITKSISLSQLDPSALLELRTTGECEIRIPEVLFDLDYPGHYCRRIKGVRITIPALGGPYTNISASLNLLNSWTRRDTDLNNPPTEDAVMLPQKAITTSTASTDTGMFEWNFSDVRLLPFEGAGVISVWKLSLPTTLRAFDYDTISDVVMHMSYTAKESTDLLFKQTIKDQLLSQVNRWIIDVNSGATIKGPTRLVSVRHDFPSEWARLINTDETQSQQVSLDLSAGEFFSMSKHIWLPGSDGLMAKPLIIRFAGNPIPLFQSTSPSTEDDGVPNIQISGLNDIDEHHQATITLNVIEGRIAADRWKDLLLLFGYELTY